MAHLIDKDALVAEIEKQMERAKFKGQQAQENNDYVSYFGWSERFATCGDILKIINNIEVKEVDMESVFNNEYSKFSNDIDAEYAFPIDLADYKDFAKYFFELGIAARTDK